MKTYIIIKDDKVIDYLYAEKKPTNGHEVTKFCGFIGLKTSYYTDNYSRVKSEGELLTEGIKKVYYNTDTQQEQVFDVQEVPDTYTDKKPLTQYDDWNGTKWVYNKDKHIAEKIQQVKEACEYNILNRLPFYKQINLSVRGMELLEKYTLFLQEVSLGTKQQTDKCYTDEEKNELLYIKSENEWKNRIRTQSDTMEAAIENMTKYEDIENYVISFEE